MACEVCAGSCSLCPWCDSEHCPHYHDHDNDKRYWVYATNRKNSTLHQLANLNTKKEAAEFVKKLVGRRWGKNYKLVKYIDTSVTRGEFYKTENGETPYVEITITDGECSWYDAVNLIINTEDKTISYYNPRKTQFSPYINEGQEYCVEIIKPWDGKLNFIEHNELPWYREEEK